MMLATIKDTARAQAYCSVMASRRPKTQDSVAGNLRRLMTMVHWSQVRLAKESGVSQTHISAILRGDSSCTVETAESLAKAFGLKGWHLLIPNLPDELISSPSLSRLMDAYIHSDAAGRDFLDAAASRELKR